MPQLEALLNDLANFDAQHDFDGLRRVREQIVAEHAASDEAVEAMYKLGLDLLFRQRDLDAAVEQFLTASKRKHPYWSPAARTSLGLCYYHQKQLPKALLELRKVAYPDTPNAHSVTALSFLETIFDAEGQKDEVKKARKDRILQLTALCKAAKEAERNHEAGYYLYSLALAFKDNGEGDKAKERLLEAKALGRDALGPDLDRSVQEALGWR